MEGMWARERGSQGKEADGRNVSKGERVAREGGRWKECRRGREGWKGRSQGKEDRQRAREGGWRREGGYFLGHY
jgi:hypothetical protein